MVNSFLLLLQRTPLTKEISKISLKQSSEENFHVAFCIALMHSSETQIKLLFRGTSKFVFVQLFREKSKLFCHFLCVLHILPSKTFFLDLQKS
jgi:hypothetical protein